MVSTTGLHAVNRRRSDTDDDSVGTLSLTAQTSSSSNSNASELRSRGVTRRAKFERADTPVIESIERGSLNQSDDQSTCSPSSTNSSLLAGDQTSSAKDGEQQPGGLMIKENFFRDVDVDKYMSRREMTPLQERINAITVMPGSFYCILFLLSGAWLDRRVKDEVGYEMMTSTAHDIDESRCISSPLFPHLHAIPPMPVIAVAVGILLHFPFSFIYHWHYAHQLPPGLARTTHWSRRMDQAMIHALNACLSYATSGRLDYFLVNLVFNVDCMLRLFKPQVYPRRNQIRIFITAFAYTVPILKRGDFRLFTELWILLGVGAWLFAAYPIGGWSHAFFHVALSFLPPLLMACAIQIPASQDQLKVAARCAFLEEHRL